MSVFALCPVVFYKNALVLSNTSYFSLAYFSYFYKSYVSVSTTKYDLKMYFTIRPLHSYAYFLYNVRMLKYAYLDVL